MAEKAFFEAYKKVTDLADPLPVLEHAAEAMKGLGKVADMEIEVRRQGVMWAIFSLLHSDKWIIQIIMGQIFCSLSHPLVSISLMLFSYIGVLLLVSP